MASDTTITVSRTAKQEFDRAKEQLGAANSTETLELLVEIASAEGYFEGESVDSLADRDDVDELDARVSEVEDMLDAHREALFELKDRVETLESE